MNRVYSAISLAGIVGACATAQPPDIGAVYYHPRVINNAEYLFHNSPNEWHLCLRGEMEGDTLVVSRAELPVILEASPMHVTYQLCDVEDYVGTLHPHLNGVGIPSEIDKATWAEDKRALINAIFTGTQIITWRRNEK